ncbi:MAG: rSAM/selenodomain-associated transferase 1 [Granulosicoccus sp.]|jgi:rSAM/selenodomain-associated transferase 1
MAIIVFIKNIEKGKVKTRLAATVGDDQALKIYEALLEHTQKVVRAVDAERFLFYSSFVEKEDEWSADFFHKKVQSQGDLGSRMSDAFQDVLEKNGKAIIVGSDCASLTPEIIKAALDKLDEYPFVIGPTFDGGYYLLGMNSFEPSVFENIEWSTETVFPKTLLRMASLEKRCYFMPQLSDIDYEEDWVKYGWDLTPVP